MGAKPAGTLVDRVVAAISPRRQRGIGIAEISARVGLEQTQVRNAVGRAVEQGRLQRIGRGLYIR